ncbi:hypothetical protein BT69DRAFT_1288075, partial [Atractiella rhizophila]
MNKELTFSVFSIAFVAHRIPSLLSYERSWVRSFNEDERRYRADREVSQSRPDVCNASFFRKGAQRMLHLEKADLPGRTSRFAHLAMAWIEPEIQEVQSFKRLLEGVQQVWERTSIELITRQDEFTDVSMTLREWSCEGAAPARKGERDETLYGENARK